MRFENEKGWIEIEFNNYAECVGGYSNDLYDLRNSVDLSFHFSEEGVGWGCGGFEYFLTTDIQVLEKGATDILILAADQFSHSVLFPYPVLLENKEYCVFSFCRCADGIKVDLRMWDGLWEYLEITQIFDESGFAELVGELKHAARMFPVRASQ